MKTSEIRKTFIEFFEDKGHKAVIAAPVAPLNDPTLLFTNAGMNQFKDVFLGTGSRPYTRAVDSQPCIRVSGKHNDLEEVGHDTYHHTLFEMLGNWSFGDYYKKEAIEWAWELLTEKFGIDKNKLYATVYRTDDEAAELWAEVTDIDPSKILKFDEKDNFWEMGDTGPCGPCSEIHIDLGEGYCDKQHEDGHECAVNAGCSRFIELWNLVFIQYNRGKDGQLTELPSKHVDTGAGLERLAAVLNDVQSNYDTDIFAGIISKIAELSGVKYTQDKGIPHRVIADHIRNLVFAIADGVMPSNEGRGYVIRRILRRAVRYGKNIGFNDAFLYKVADSVIEYMGEAYPTIVKRADYIKKVIKSEEDNFIRTLDKGIELFNELINDLKKSNSDIIPGKDAFKLYDTYGFPFDLTSLMAKENGFTVDEKSFEEEMAKQKERARAASNFNIDDENGDSSEEKPLGGEARIAKTDDELLGISQHHTATHLLQAALQEILGDHVKQAGSLVDIDRLRFDFNHFQALTEIELKTVETLVNDKIMNNIKLDIREEEYDKALELGAMALFGEKYGDKVRVVKIDDFSIELCGGHHLDSTGQIGLFKIVSESAVAAGIRRIEAICGKTALSYIQNNTEIVNKISRMLKVSDSKIVAKIEDNLVQIKKLEKEINSINSKLVLSSTDDIVKEADTISGIKVMIKPLKGIDGKSLADLADNVIEKVDKGIALLISDNGDKVNIVAKCTKTLAGDGVNCSDLIKKTASICGGNGGGSPFMAKAGAKDSSKITEAITEAQKLIGEMIGA